MLADNVRRAADILAGLALLPGAVACMVQRPWTRTCYVGQSGRRFEVWRNRDGRTPLPLYAFNLLAGDMSLVGPRPLPQKEFEGVSTIPCARFNVRPGLINLWWVRRATNIDFGTEWETDEEYVRTRSLKTDASLVLRAIPAALYGQRQGDPPRFLHLLGLRVDNLTMDEAISEVLDRIENGQGTSQVCFLNADCVNLAFRHREYADVLTRADFVLPDGIGLKLAGRLHRQDIRHNVNGTDLFPRLCRALEHSGHGIFFLGGRPDVLGGLLIRLAEQYPGLPVAGAHHGYFKPEETDQVVETIRRSGAKLLLVGMGAPRQDVWISRFAAATGVRVAMGVGGLFDFYSGRIPRAPMWMREIGFEWAWRLAQEPRRMWRRYLVGNAVFMARTVAYRGQSPLQPLLTGPPKPVFSPAPPSRMEQPAVSVNPVDVRKDRP